MWFWSNLVIFMNALPHLSRRNFFASVFLGHMSACKKIIMTIWLILKTYFGDIWVLLLIWLGESKTAGEKTPCFLNLWYTLFLTFLKPWKIVEAPWGFVSAFRCVWESVTTQWKWENQALSWLDVYLRVKNIKDPGRIQNPLKHLTRTFLRK